MKTSRRNFFIAFVVVISWVLSSCSDSVSTDSTIGNWTKTTPFKGRPRSGAVVFTVGSKAFVGLGYDGDDYLADFYSIDIDEGYWVSRQSFPGTLRERAVAFSINGKGYIALGYNRDLDQEELKDVWEYDPDLDTWTQLSDFEGSARYNSVAFTVGSKAYIGTGYDGITYNSDFWEFDPAQEDSWSEIQSYPGEKIEEGLAFTIGNKGYVCAGRNNGSYNLDFWEYDPEGKTWTKRSPDDNESYYDDFKLAVRRHDAVAVVKDSKAYLIGGVASSGAMDGSVYEFDASTMKWDQKTSFEGSARSLAVGFALEGRTFVGTGQNGTKRYDDIWEFKPDEEYDEIN
ncbi:MAG TPA: galactose oxidase [Cyclobacteriaceae bacterium]|nr:galactose oxidase [Cyclobacteriaceae bacterium]